MSSVYSTYPDTPLSPPSTTETLWFCPTNNSSLHNFCRQPCLFPGTSVLVQQAEHSVPCARMSPLPSATTLHYRGFVTSGLSSAQVLTQVEVHIAFSLWDQHPQPHLSHTRMFLSTSPTTYDSAPAQFSSSSFCLHNKALHITHRGVNSFPYPNQHSCPTLI